MKEDLWMWPKEDGISFFKWAYTSQQCSAAFDPVTGSFTTLQTNYLTIW